MSRSPHRNPGFTLIELIGFITVFGMVASFLVAYMSSTVPKSAVAYNWVQQENDMGNTMEDAVAEYIRQANSNNEAFDVTGYETFIQSLGSDYTSVTKQYVCFDDDGNMSSCSDEQILLVTVTDPNGRVQHSLFSKTREASEPHREH